MGETESEKPNAKVIGEDGNVFSTLGISSRALKRAGKNEQVEEMRERVMSSGSYGEALNIMQEYVNFVDSACDDDEED